VFAAYGYCSLPRGQVVPRRLKLCRTHVVLPGVYLRSGVDRFRGPCHFFFGGVGGAPFAEGLDAFCLGGAAFFGFRTSLLPFAMYSSLMLDWKRLNGRSRCSMPTFPTYAFHAAR
jgi:hypothetical protein